METKKIYLETFSASLRELLPFLQEKLSLIFHLPVEKGKELELPEGALNHYRKQYEASRLLEEVSSLPSGKSLGITSVDLFAPGLNFVFGQAEIGGKRGLISTARLDPRFYREEFNKALFLKRVLKEAVHELGHTFGLRHCRNPECVMFFSNSLSDTDKKSEKFCPLCEQSFLSTCNFSGDG
jgi:archaemetzincin